MTDQPRKTFASTQERIWDELASQLHGKFQNEPGITRDRIVAQVDHWRIVLDIHVYPGWHMQQHFTRLRAPFINAEGFRFHLHRNGPLGQLADITGLDRLGSDIKIGDAAFDRHFTIRSNRPETIKSLLASARVRDLLEQAGNVRVDVLADDGEFGPYFPPAVDELRLETPDQVQSLERLRVFYNLFAEILHGMCHLGSAYERDPKLEI